MGFAGGALCKYERWVCLWGGAVETGIVGERWAVWRMQKGGMGKWQGLQDSQGKWLWWLAKRRCWSGATQRAPMEVTSRGAVRMGWADGGEGPGLQQNQG